MTPVTGLQAHLAILPVAVPLLVGALLLIARPAGRAAPVIGLASLACQLAVAVMLMVQAEDSRPLVYQLGNWPAPFGISLVADRLAALMLVMAGLVGVACQVAATGAASRRFPALLQLQMAGLNGAFLTGDLFNLFVCFEVLLAASYALLLDSQGPQRLRAGLHYVAINLLGSAVFLVAVATFYGIAGTLNLADLAGRLPGLDPAAGVLAESAGLLLLVVFAIKAAALPLGLWLPGTYGVVPAHVAALFAIMTKVGIYSIARVHGTLFAPGADPSLASSAGFVLPWLLGGGLATLLFGALGALAARDMRTLVAWLVAGSSGTLLVGLGLGSTTGLAAALYYLPHSTLTAGAMFLVVEMVARARRTSAPLQRYRVDAGSPVEPGAAARIGVLFFVSVLLVGGLPPGSGFIGKALLLEAAAQHAQAGWIWGAVLTAGFVTLLALVRCATTVFWKYSGSAPATAALDGTAPAAGLMAAALWLLGGAALLVVLARPMHAFALRAAAAMGLT